MTDKTQTFSAFAQAFIDCLILFSKRLRGSTHRVVRSLVEGNSYPNGTNSEYPSGDILRDFVRNQTTRFAEEILHGRLQLDPPAAAKPLSAVVIQLDEVDPGVAYFAAFSVIH